MYIECALKKFSAQLTLSSETEKTEVTSQFPQTDLSLKITYSLLTVKEIAEVGNERLHRH